MGLEKCRLIVLALACLTVVGCSSSGWERSGEETTTSSPVLSGETVFYATTRFGVMHYLNAILLDSGRSAWQMRLRGWEPYTHVVVGEGVVIAAGPEFARAFDRVTGRPRWRLRLDSDRVDVLDTRDRMLVVGVTGKTGARELLLLRLDIGEVRAVRPVDPGDKVWTGPAAIYLGDGNSVTALEPSTGVERWTSTLPVRPDDLRVAGDTIVIVGPDRLVGVGRDTGMVQWVRETDGEVTFRARGADGCYAQGGKIHMIDTLTGGDRWERRIAGVVHAPRLASQHVWVHTAGGWLLALERTNGQVLWRANVGPPGDIAAAGDRFYAWLQDDGVHLADLQRREARTIIPATTEPSVPAPGGGSVPVMGMSGPWMWYVGSGGSRVVVRRLGS